MIVLDASAALSALLTAGAARSAIAEEQLHAPHLIDSEVANVLRRRVATGALGTEEGRVILSTWQALGIIRYPAVAMLTRIWELRENLSAYDATYVALAEALDCPLVTADKRLSRAAGIRCPVTTVPS
jgi:predicted nucleic acid-binding protein